MMENTATSWLLYDLTRSPVMLGLGGLCRTVPILLLALLGGALADRVSRRSILMVTQFTSVGTSFVLGSLVLSGLVQPWHVYLFNVLNSTVSAFDVPTRQALFPDLVPREEIHAAVSLNTMMARICNLVGPAAAGIMMDGIGTWAPFYFNALSYLALVGALLAMRIAHEARPVQIALAQHVREGLLFVKNDAVLLPLLIVEALVNAFGHNNAMLTIFARDVLNAGPSGLGLLRSAIAGGAMLGMAALILAREVEHKGRLIVLSGLVYAASIAAFALSRSLELSMLILVVLGMADAVWGVTRNTLAQLAAPQALRGRVMSLVVLVTRGTTPAAEFQNGALTAVLAPTGAALVGAAVVCAAVVATASVSPKLRQHGRPERDATEGAPVYVIVRAGRRRVRRGSARRCTLLAAA